MSVNVLSVTWGKAKMQITVTASLTRSMDSEIDGHSGMATAVLHCWESVAN